MLYDALKEKGLTKDSSLSVNLDFIEQIKEDPENILWYDR
jgi:hypothetical protein